MDTKHPTPYLYVNEAIQEYTKNVNALLGKNILGIYLFGSLSYNDFNPDRSDIDLSVVVKNPLTQEEGEKIKVLHESLERKLPLWKERIECSYTPLALFANTLPPKEPRPYFGGGIFYFQAPYGNEWLINNYLLYHKSISLQGPEFSSLVKSIDIKDVQQACIRDLYQEWEPKLKDREWLSNSHYQSYLVLNLCRILYTVMQKDVGSKTISAAWVKNTYATQWKGLIEEADQWKHGMEMKRQSDVLRFLRFVLDKIPPLTK